MQTVVLVSSPMEENIKEYYSYFTGETAQVPDLLKHFETPTSFVNWAKDVGLKIELAHDETHKSWDIEVNMTEEQVVEYKRFMTENAKFHKLM